MIKITCKLTGHELSLVNAPIVSSDSVEFDAVKFQFDTNWTGFHKVAVFWGSDTDTAYGSLVDDNDEAVIPTAILEEKATIRFGVFGEDPDGLLPRITSTILKYKIKEGAWSESFYGDDEATQSLVDQLRVLVFAISEETHQFVEDSTEAYETFTENSTEAYEAFTQECTDIVEAAKDYVLDAMETKVEKDMPGIITDWLDDHVNPESDVVIDDTLSISGAAADAAACGVLKSQINTIGIEIGIVNCIVKNEAMYLTTGYNIFTRLPNTKRASTNTIYVPSGNKYIVAASGFGQYGYSVSANGQTITSVVSWQQGTQLNVTFEGPVWFALMFANADNTTDINHNDINITIRTEDFINGRIEQVEEALIPTLMPYGMDGGFMKENGTIVNTSIANRIKKYTVSDGLNKIWIKGTSLLSVASPKYCVLWFVKNNAMMAGEYITADTNPQTFNYFEVSVPNEAEEIWVYYNIDICITSEINHQLQSNLQEAQKNISLLQQQIASSVSVGLQWSGKTWYAYGTSLTNTNNEGKYPTYLAQMSGMTFVNKGISGGGIGNLGAYSHGQVYNAICNITDGKTNADLITLETGANDIAADVPLGDVYDTGTQTLSGCLNDCIHYLQENTNAQIVVIPSPCGKQTLDKAFQWAEMVKEICDINRVTCLSPNQNVGRAKENSTKGSLYLVDNIHQTDLGGYVFALYLWYQLRNIPCFYAAMPT